MEAKSNSKPSLEKKGTPPSVTCASDKSPGSADCKATTSKTASLLMTPSENQGKAAKPPQDQPARMPTQELQAKFAAIEELVEAKEHLMEKEKGKVLEELEHAKKVADEANVKLQEALAEAGHGG